MRFNGNSESFGIFLICVVANSFSTQRRRSHHRLVKSKPFLCVFVISVSLDGSISLSVFVKPPSIIYSRNQPKVSTFSPNSNSSSFSSSCSSLPSNARFFRAPGEKVSILLNGSMVNLAKRNSFFFVVQEKLVVDNGSTNETSPASKEASSGFPESPNRDVNRRVAVASVVAALALFLSTRLDFGISLKDLTASALPYEEVGLFVLLVLVLLNFIRMINE